jgi:hypothetical protein
MGSFPWTKKSPGIALRNQVDNQRSALEEECEKKRKIINHERLQRTKACFSSRDVSIKPTKHTLLFLCAGIL